MSVLGRLRPGVLRGQAVALTLLLASCGQGPLVVPVLADAQAVDADEDGTTLPDAEPPDAVSSDDADAEPPEDALDTPPEPDGNTPDADGDVADDPDAGDSDTEGPDAADADASADAPADAPDASTDAPDSADDAVDAPDSADDASDSAVDAADAADDAVDAPDVADDAPDGACRGAGCACNAVSQGSVCAGLPCVDGVCCASVCDGPCRSCNLPGSLGTCAPLPAGTDSGGDCSAGPADTCGWDGTCDGSGACAYHEGTVCDDGEACSVDDTCDGAGRCIGEIPSTCGPGAGNECCLGACADGAGCATLAGPCPDVCGANDLFVGTACVGCGAPGAVGICDDGEVFRCDEEVHSPCEEVVCGGVPRWCTNVGGVWAWREGVACDDGDACTYGDVCSEGTCGGAPVVCESEGCIERTCDGTETCVERVRVGAACDDGEACTYGDVCDDDGACVSAGSVVCESEPCVERTCNGSPSCTQTILTGAACDDGDSCTYGDVCSPTGACAAAGTATCAPDTVCATYACNGTSICRLSPRNAGLACDDGNAVTTEDTCNSHGRCVGTFPCAVPSAACEDGSESREGCDNARTISRLTAGSGGWSIADDTCESLDRSDEAGACFDAGPDHMYRIYMREGEALTARLIAGSGCATGSWAATLKVYESTSGCTVSDCPAERRVYCEDFVADQTARHTATKDGWVTVIVDGSTAFDDDGDYTLNVQLTCLEAGCTCSD